MKSESVFLRRKMNHTNDKADVSHLGPNRNIVESADYSLPTSLLTTVVNDPHNTMNMEPLVHNIDMNQQAINGENIYNMLL